jgi:hypothetical protein
MLFRFFVRDESLFMKLEILVGDPTQNEWRAMPMKHTFCSVKTGMRQRMTYLRRPPRLPRQNAVDVSFLRDACCAGF